MVVSLESQKVKIKKSNYVYRGHQTINFNIPNIFKLFNLKILLYLISFAVLFFFIISIKDLVLYNKKVSLDVNSINLPYHKPDVNIRDDISGYNINQKYTLYDDYRYSSKESLSSIAVKYGISINTILNVNSIKDIRHIEDGHILLVPRVDGIIHKVNKDDTLISVSKRYKVAIKDIFKVNSLKSETLVIGSDLFVPGADNVRWGISTNLHNYFLYPVKGYITKRYGEYISPLTGLKESYEGLDFTSGENVSVFSSKAGQVSKVGYNANYGNYIFVDHSGGYRTLYAHLSKIFVSTRDKVDQNTVLGEIGSSGYVDKDKLFFCMLYKNETVNPEKYLK